MSTTDTPRQQFEWKTWPEAERLVVEWIEAILARVEPAADFVGRLERATSTQALDWVDYILVGASSAPLAAVGYEKASLPVPDGLSVWRHPGAQLPNVLSAEDGPHAVALKCDRVADVLLANGLNREIVGRPGEPLRQATLWQDNDAELRVVERHGYAGYTPATWSPEQILLVRQAEETWRTRPRHFEDDAAGMAQTLELARRMVELIGPDCTASLAMSAERDYWQRRNRAGQVQKARQDALGFGWANHDHHTFRSSREHFYRLIEIFETFGFANRERFWAGAEAGWGAQVMEQPRAGLVVFADVDLAPQEVLIDFAHRPLPPRDELGTVGLWCGLHGESILAAGMHHLELQFSFDRLRDDLSAEGVGMMKPFSDMEHLRQAFTEGQIWPVDRRRVERLRKAGLVDAAQAERFIRDGAIGSHMEDLQRRYGFKGFNQKSVSDIIRATDPRTAGG